MYNEGLHEDKDDISKETRDQHRALLSLQEELEAIDWYRQRADVCDNKQLKAILLHNMREEMEHAAMLIEWLRRSDNDLSDHLRDYLFTDTPITEIEENTSVETETASNEGRTIGTLKD